MTENSGAAKVLTYSQIQELMAKAWNEMADICAMGPQRPDPIEPVTAAGWLPNRDGTVTKWVLRAATGTSAAGVPLQDYYVATVTLRAGAQPGQWERACGYVAGILTEMLQAREREAFREVQEHLEQRGSELFRPAAYSSRPCSVCGTLRPLPQLTAFEGKLVCLNACSVKR